MDNGQKGQNSSSTSVFVPDDTSLPTGQGESGLEADVNLADNASWTPERDSRTIGNKAIFSSEEPTGEGKGDITPSPVNTEEVKSTNEPAKKEEVKNESPAPPIINEEHIRVEDDHISRSALEEISQAEQRLAQTDDMSTFYDEICTMRSMMRDSFEKPKKEPES